MSNENDKNCPLEGQKAAEASPLLCPFCGSVAAIHMMQETVSGKTKIDYNVRCHDTRGDCPCTPSTSYFKTEKEALAAWDCRETTVS